MAINWDELSPEQILAKAKEVEEAATKAEKGIEALENKRDELLVEVKKRKKAMRMLAERGVDPLKPDYEDKLSDLMVSLDDFLEKKGQGSDDPGDSAKNPPASDANSLPADMNPEMKKMLDRMTRQITDLNTKLVDTETKLQEKDAESKRSFVKNAVIDKLVDLGVKKKKAEHLYLLTQDKYNISDDGNGEMSVYGGDEYDPVPLDTIIGNLRDSDDFGDYFPGSGNSGSGMHQNQGGSSTVPIADNPFANGNATEAARILESNPAKGKMLLNQARAAGKLPPAMARAFANK
jgi:hypothetical protein